MTLATRIIRNSQIFKNSLSVSPLLSYIKVGISAENMVTFFVYPQVKTASTVLNSKKVKIAPSHHMQIFYFEFHQNRLRNKKFGVNFNLCPKKCINFNVQFSRNSGMWVSLKKKLFRI